MKMVSSTKRLVVALMAVGLALSGCNRAPSTASKTDVSDQSEGPSAGADAAPAGGSQGTLLPAVRRQIISEDVPLLEQINRENTKVVAAALPCIVRITAVGPVDPHAQLFDLPFKIPGLPHGMRSLVPSYGSGVVISHDGYIVTNFHVIEDAQTVEVQLRDQRSFPARVVASDAPSDVAVLKINATDLPALPWGDSDKVQVGEQVFAIGNPFDLDDSVSRGIVSAKGRNLPESNNYEDYIQTDAAINVGNSGGALVNIHGELIGINAAIASYTRGNEGVGFSIPSNLVRYTVGALLKEGRLIRGYLGVRLPLKIDDGVEQQLGLEDGHGALLAGVLRSSPAEQARLRPVDFITEVDGRKIGSVADLRLIVSQIPVGREVGVSFIRGGSTHSAKIKIAELPKDEETAPPTPELQVDPDAVNPSLAPAPVDDVLNGLQVADLNDKTRQKFAIDGMITSGVVVTNVVEGSPSDAKGVLRGDVIEIACAQKATIQPLANAGDFTGLLKKLKADQGVVLLVHRGRTSNFLYLAPMTK